MLSKGAIDSIFRPNAALAISLLLCLFILSQTFLRSPFPGGVDASTHLFQISLVASDGLTSWNHWWYAGHPLLEQYPPLSHLSGALISNLVGVENAYKIVLSFIFLLIPISFYLLLKEFPFSDEQKAFALYFFSFSPVYSYYLQGGVFSALFALPFSILFLKFLIRTLNSKKWLFHAILSALSLAIVALSHLLMPVAAALFAFLYFLSLKPSIDLLKRLALIGILSFCLVAFFWVPLALNYTIQGDPANLSSLSSFQISTLAFAPFGRSFAVYINYISLLLVTLLGISILFFLYRDYAGKERSYANFFILSIFAIIFWILFLPHSGQAGGKLPLFIPLIFSLFLCRHFNPKSQSRYLFLALPILLLFSTLLVQPSYFPPETYSFASFAANHTQSRALLLPQGFGLMEKFSSKANADTYLYEVYLLPHYFEKEIYNGWFGEAIPREDIAKTTFDCWHARTPPEILSEIGPFSRIILNRIDPSCAISVSPQKFCQIIQEGSVDSIFANSNFPSVVQFADSAPCLSRAGLSGPLIAYNVINPEPYVGSNFTYSKKSGTISIQINGPYRGSLTVRESYYPYWKAHVDGQEVPVQKSEYGFLSIPLDLGEGSHELKIVYSPDNYFGVFDALSLISIIIVLAFIARPGAFKYFSSKIERLA